MRRATVSEADAGGYIVTSVSDQTPDGRKSWSTRHGLETSSEVVYDGNGGATETAIQPDGSKVINAYNGGRMASRQRQLGSGTVISSTSLGYDPHGRLHTETDGRTGTVTTYAYNANDQIVSVSTGSMSSSYDYNSLGQQTGGTLPGSGRTITRAYLPTGEVTEIGGTAEYPVSFTYDPQGRPTGMITSSGTTGWTYDSQRGWMTAKSDAAGQQTKYLYRPSGRAQKRTWARGVSTRYFYNAGGDLTGINYSDSTPALNISYDQRGRPASVSDAAGSRTLAYNGAGQLVSDTITGASLWSGLSITNTYDTLLRRNAFAAARGGTSLAESGFGYDGASRLAAVTSGSHTATYGYLANSSLVDSIAFGQGGATVTTMNKAYDALDRLSSIGTTNTASGTRAYGYTYNAAGQRSEATLTGGSAWHYGYNVRGEVTSGSKKLSGGTDALGYQFGYTFDAIGNRTATSVNGRSATYTPNAVNEYLSRTVPGYADVVGQAHPDTTVTVNSATATRQSGGGYHKELAADNSAGAAYLTVAVQGERNGQTATREGEIFLPQTPEAFTYDVDGNLKSDGRWTYAWDAENRLAKMETSLAAATAGAPVQRLTFTYDYMGRRIGKRVENWSGTAYEHHHTILFVYDGWNLAAEVLAGSYLKIRSYTWGSDLSGGRAAGGVGGLLFVEQQPENKTFSVGYDGNGNVTGLFDMGAAGALAASYEYGPFGELISQSGTFAAVNPIRWSTKYQDMESGLVYYGFRYYNPETGRWLNRDPIEEDGGVNLYGFVDNSPTNYCDALGLWKQDSQSLGGKRRVVFIEKDDKIDGLARTVKLDSKKSELWLFNETKSTWVKTDSDLAQGCKYSIPNEVFIDYGRRKGFWEFMPTNIFFSWEAEVSSIKSHLVSQGYLVTGPGARDAGGSIIRKHLEEKNLYGYIYVGHGAGDGILGLEPDVISPSRYSAHGLAFLYLYACGSADSEPEAINKKRGLTLNSWQLNVSPLGRFLGFVGETNSFNQDKRRRNGPGPQLP